MTSREGGRPHSPWLPAAVHVYGIYTREREVWVRVANGERQRRVRRRYDVRFRVDDHEFRYGLDQKGWADDFEHRLREDFAKGLLFDPSARRFLAANAESTSADEGPSFVEHACDYFARQWDRWAPSTRCSAQRDLALACVYLLRDEAEPLTPGDRAAIVSYLRRVRLAGPAGEEPSEDEHHDADWLAKWSMPLAQVTDAHLRAFIDRIRTERLDGSSRRLADSSVVRVRANVRAAFTNARKRRLISWDPWDAIEAEPLRDHERVDPDLVMDPGEVRQMAAACASIHPRYHAYVLIQGLCGLRPGETDALRRRDLDLTGLPATVNAGGTHSWVPDRFFADGETRRRPLKGRGKKVSRRIPIPDELVPLLQEHLDKYVGNRRDTAVFANAAGGLINSSNFHRDVWSKAREAVFAEDSPLRRVRRHDLRHAAITTWLNAGVPLKTAQRWSGHNTLAVLLDTYLGVMKGDEAIAIERVAAALRPESRDGLVTGLADSDG